jgi:hypothetical protein
MLTLLHVPDTLALQVVSKLHNLLKPFMLRRLKADVEICLPRKQEVLLYAPMSEQQQTINSQLLEKTLGVRGPRLAMVLRWTLRLLWQCTCCQLTAVRYMATAGSVKRCRRTAARCSQPYLHHVHSLHPSGCRLTLSRFSVLHFAPLINLCRTRWPSLLSWRAPAAAAATPRPS